MSLHQEKQYQIEEAPPKQQPLPPRRPAPRPAKKYNAVQRAVRKMVYGDKAKPAPPRRALYNEPVAGSNAYAREIQKKKEARRRKLRLQRIALLVSVVLIVVGIFAIRLMLDLNVGDTFYANVYVDDLPLNGLTKEGAVEKLTLQNKARIDAANVTLVYGDQVWEIAAPDYSVSLDVEAQVNAAWEVGRNGNIFERQNAIHALSEAPYRAETKISYNEDILGARLQEIKKRVDLAPKDAVMHFDADSSSDRFTYEEERVGRSMNIENVKNQIFANLESGAAGMVTIVPDTVEPTVTRTMLQQSSTEVSNASTSLEKSDDDRDHNVALALSHFDGFIVKPGEEISFNDVVGDRTAEMGYRPAPEINRGELVEGVGGGICQASTTLYNALVKADLEILERHEHSRRVGYVAVGKDAAVDYGTKDFRFRNNKDYPIYIVTSASNDSCRVRIYGKPLPDGVFVRLVPDMENMRESKMPDAKTVKDVEGLHTDVEGEEVTVNGQPYTKVETYRVYYTAGEDGKPDTEDDVEVKRTLEAESSYQAVQPVIYVGVDPDDRI